MQDVIQLLQKSPDSFPSIEIKFCAQEYALDPISFFEMKGSDTSHTCYRM